MSQSSGTTYLYDGTSGSPGGTVSMDGVLALPEVMAKFFERSHYEKSAAIAMTDPVRTATPMSRFDPSACVTGLADIL